MFTDTNQRRQLALSSIFTGALLTGLAGCGGGTASGVVDYREYALPAVSGTHEFDEYTRASDGSSVFLERNVQQFTVIPGHVVLTTDTGESHVIIEDSMLIFDPGTSGEFTMPRSVKQGDVFKDSDGNPFAIFGPYKNWAFTMYGAPDVKRQDGSVLIEIYRRDQDEFSDVYVRHFAKGIGAVGLTRYELCPRNIALDISLDYQALCEDTFPGEILVTPQ